MYTIDGIKVVMRDDGRGNTVVVLLEAVAVGGVSVPKGFVSDGASLPRSAWRVIGHPFSCRYLAEAVCHDWLYHTGKLGRAEADKWFYNAIRGKKRFWLRSKLVYIAVRLFGHVAWNKHRKGGK